MTPKEYTQEDMKKAFEAGVDYWSWVQTDEPMLHKPMDFKEWIEKYKTHINLI